MALDDKLMDLRLRDRLVSEGKISTSQVDEYLKSISDDKDNYTKVEDKKETDLLEE